MRVESDSVVALRRLFNFLNPLTRVLDAKHLKPDLSQRERKILIAKKTKSGEGHLLAENSSHYLSKKIQLTIQVRSLELICAQPRPILIQTILLFEYLERRSNLLGVNSSPSHSNFELASI